MKRGPIWKVSVTTTPQAEDAVSDLLTTVFNHPASSYTDAETGVTMVSVYCLEGLSDRSQLRAAVRRGVLHSKECGLEVGEGTISIRKIRREDWAESWKRHFKPIEVGKALLIKPSWINRLPKRNQAVVVLDPGLSFGTGQHPTTAFCLEQLVRRRKPGVPQSFLDIGTGSGILAIAAAKLGCSPVRAFDFDPEAVRVAQANARVNGVAHQVCIGRADVTKRFAKRGERYDVICANLISPLLIAQRRCIAALLQDGGTLVVAGILSREFGQVRNAFEACGLRLVASKSLNEWRSGSFIGNLR
jgi:ribosomal protein L11 methyltransferase